MIRLETFGPLHLIAQAKKLILGARRMEKLLKVKAGAVSVIRIILGFCAAMQAMYSRIGLICCFSCTCERVD